MISITIPFYNEEKNVVAVVDSLVKKLGDAGIDYELVLVNNGSTDKTPELLKKLSKKYKRIRVIAIYPNQGFGWGIINGLKACRGDIIGFMCGDGQIAPKDLIRVIRKFEKDGFDFCQVKRVERDDGIYRLFLSKGFNLLAHILFRIPTSDIGGNPKIMKRVLFKKINLVSKGWFMETEMLNKIAKFNPKVAEIPVVFKRRGEGKSNIKFSVVFEFLKNIALYKLNRLE